ncbi:dihydrofolate reductase [Bifidobacterium margollesii]|uniref:dihydrofolate reductase n=1 Tax=Bifidobacterium margollesii TaxID=2020964 RepID=A0A2N5JA60_9BIFI|nr:dihydrofolate reductase [Bifidobacterium margollesii]PLS31103.1 dihydrofolate reductase [Bifidobacterium margollesii]
MEHDSSRSGYHEPKPGIAGRYEEEWENEDLHDDDLRPIVVNLIWAQARSKDGREGAIGFEGTMPWHLSEDLKHFKSLTISHPVVMGRKTWESLGERYRPLPNRDNIVISRDGKYHAAGATVVDSLDDALDLARQESIPDDGIERNEIWVIGGAQIFEQALPFASRAFVTEIDADFDADAFAPDLAALVHAGEWKVATETGWMKPEKAEGINGYRFVKYERARR